MTDDGSRPPDPRLDRLSLALDAFLAWRADGSRGADELLDENEDLRDLLLPMLDETVDAGASTRVRDGLDEDRELGPEAPRRLGEFRVVRELGRGAMGVVYEAVQESLGRAVALKVLPADRTTPRGLARFRRESATLARLQHDGIAEVIAVGADAGVHYYAMELVDGEPLDLLIGRTRLERERDPATSPRRRPGGSTTLADAVFGSRSERSPSGSASSATRVATWMVGHIAAAVSIVEQLAESLHHAHRHGVVHRDVKPSNVLVRADGRPVLTDFGLAREVDAPSLTMTGEFAGTPYYVAPEQVTGRPEDLSPSADVFSLGVVLYELLTLQRPFVGATSHEVLQAIVSSEPIDPQRLEPRVPDDLAAIVTKCLEKAPLRRYGSALAVADDLRALRELRPVTARRATRAQRTLRWIRREPVVASLAGLLALAVPALTGLGGYLLATRSELEAGRETLAEQQLTDRLAAMMLVADGAPDEALARARAIVAEYPDSAVGQAAAVIVHTGADQDRRALVLLDAALARPALAGSRSLRRLRASVLGDLGRSDEAEQIVAELGEPREALEHYVLAATELRRGSRDRRPDRLDRAVAFAEAGMMAASRRLPVLDIAWAQILGHRDDERRSRFCVDVLETHWPDDAARSFWTGYALRICAPDEADARMREAVERSAEDVYFRHELAVALFRRARFAEALAHFEQSARRVPTNPRFAINRALCLQRLGRFADALAVVEAVPAAASLRGELDGCRATSLFELGRFADADAAAVEALRSDPVCESAWRVRSRVAARADGDAAGVDVLRAAHAAGCATQLIADELAVRLVGLERFEDALTELDAAIDAWPQNARLHATRGHALIELGRSDEGQIALEHALELNSDEPHAHYQLAMLARDRGEVDAAIGLYRRAIEVDAHDANAYVALGNLHVGRRETAAARDVFAALVEVAPDHAEGSVNLALTEYQLGERDAGLERLRAVVAEWPDHVQAHKNLLIMLRLLGQQGERIAEAERWLARAEDDVHRMLEVATLILDLDAPPSAGLRARGRELIDAALTRIGDHPQLLVVRARGELLGGERDAARRTVARGLELLPKLPSPQPGLEEQLRAVLTQLDAGDGRRR